MLKFLLPKSAVKAVTQAVSAIFKRAKTRFLGHKFGENSIRIGSNLTAADHREDLSLKGIFNAAAKSEGMVPNEKLYESVERSVEEYLDAHEKLATARVLHGVQSYLHNAESGSGAINPDELEEVLDDAFEKVKGDVVKVVDTESTRARNVSTLDAVSKINATLGVTDPTIAFVGPNDSHTCSECLRMFFMSDQVTPKTWKMSQVRHSYFKKGDDTPCVAGCHCFCRHSLITILPGYGFVQGSLSYIEPGFDIYQEQQKKL